MSIDTINRLRKIDDAPADGLLGVGDSLAYEVGEIDNHIHSCERWFGVAAVPDGEDHVADRIAPTIAAFTVDGGNMTWGTWLQILGPDDTPADAGNVKFDLHRIQLVAVERQNITHFIQVSFGATGADALAAGNYTELVFHPQSVQGRPAPVVVQNMRIDVDTKGWIRIVAMGQNGGELDFYIGMHEYEG